jgi:AmiR/NasT family two-component response regulator
LQSIADIAAMTIDQTHRIQQAHSLVSQLQGALDSRVVIEQAKGILAERNQTDFPSAFQEIRSIARREQRPVRTVAADIVAGLVTTS